MNKQLYQKPELVDYNNVETLTQTTGVPNQDSRTSPSDTIFPNV
jgi:hypothetical protein